jgi:hypothetical protein
MEFIIVPNRENPMIKTSSSSFGLVLTVLIFGLSSLPLAAQQQVDFEPRNVISANPIGLLANIFNVEYERVISPTSTIGLGGSTSSFANQTEIYRENNASSVYEYADIQYVNFDVFYRFYPGSRRTRTYAAPIGWAFGMKVGLTSIDGAGIGDGTYPGYGFDFNRSWVLGPNDNFYVGLGFGLKRLFGVPRVVDDWGERVSALEGKLPFGGGDLYSTIRVVNIGFIF